LAPKRHHRQARRLTNRYPTDKSAPSRFVSVSDHARLALEIAVLREANVPTFLARDGSPPIEWIIRPGLLAYEATVCAMQATAQAIAAGTAPEQVWLLEHPPLYTAGTSAKPADLLEPRFPVHQSGRGGQFTYHGPGQRIAYLMLDLRRRRPDVRAFVAAIEAWLIGALRAFGVEGERRDDRVGVWVVRSGGREDKIAAIGIRLSRWVSLHGLALNVDPRLEDFAGIRPCGIDAAQFGVTSLADLGIATSMADVDQVLQTAFEPIFGPTRRPVNRPSRTYRAR
jgi:lipoyl(octanoyl) transferase